MAKENNMTYINVKTGYKFDSNNEVSCANWVPLSELKKQKHEEKIDKIPKVKESADDDEEVEIDLESMNYNDLKKLADKLGIKYKHNIKKTDLIDLLVDE